MIEGWPAGDAVTLARAHGPRGEVALRRRGTDDRATFELIINGAFAMDSVETHSEHELGRLAASTGSGRRNVLVGGLGLGYTVDSVLDADVDHVDVVEIEFSLVDWAHQGLTPTLRRVVGDPRVSLYVGDVRLTLLGLHSEPHGPWDSILLDVDNGPDFLIHGSNEALYTESTLRAAYERLTAGGVLAIWCQGPAPELLEALLRITPDAAEHHHLVQRGARRCEYLIYTVSRPALR